jgi:hypothetical protein
VGEGRLSRKGAAVERQLILPILLSREGGCKMATTYGYVGKILRVDLTTGKITETPTSDYVPKLIGGRGVAAMIYWEEVSPECKAFAIRGRCAQKPDPATRFRCKMQL